MAANQIRTADWMQNQTLKDDLSQSVRQNWKKSEILDFIESKYPMYAWSTEADKGLSQNIYEIRKNVFKIRKNISNRNVFWKSSLKSLSNLKNYYKS